MKPGDRAWLTLDDDAKAIVSAPGETMRCVSAGEHRLALWTTGKPVLRSLTVRAVPEIMMYMLEAEEPPAAGRSFRYTWDVLSRWMLPSCNVVVSRIWDSYAPYARRWHERGGHWLGNEGMSPLRGDDVDLVGLWTRLLSNPMLDGTIHDELLPYDSPLLERYAKALGALRNVPAVAGKSVYLFSPVGIFADSALAMRYFQMDNSQACHGKTSLLVRACPERLINIRRPRLKLEPGKQYTLSAYFRTEACKRGTYTGVLVIDEGWNTSHESDLRPPEGDSAWQRVSRTFTPQPSSDGRYQLVICPPDAGKVWVDAIQLEEGGAATEYASEGGRNLLTNSDFEQGPQGWLDQARQWHDFADDVIRAEAYLAPEMYMNEVPTEQEARAAIAGFLVKSIADLRREHPGIERHLMVTFSAGNEPLAYCDDKCPGVSYKVLLDMQFHALATNSCFDGLWGVGFWTGHYMDEELTRWYAALFRHYLIEGSRERLTRDPYSLTHLTNPGFEKGAGGWTVQAAPGGIAEVVPVSAMPQGGRRDTYSPVPEGRQVLHTRRSGQVPNLISQPIAGLTPGRLYCLKLYTTDTSYSSRTLPTGIKLEGVRELPGKARNDVWAARDAGLNAHWNCHYRVFRAVGTGGRLVLADGEPGEVYWDFVQIEPYFEQ